MLVAATTASAQKQWTLQECINYAMENNITLKKSKLSKESATEELKGAKAALLPTLSASTNQSIGYRPWQDTGTATVTNGQVNAKVDKAYYNGSYSISGSWTVWNGNRNHNTIKLDQLSEEQAELSVKETANTIQERIAQIYAQILYLEESVKVAEQTLQTSKKNEERGQEMVKVGKMSKADLAQLSSQRATDEFNIVNARTELADYKLDLKQLLEITDEEDFDIVVPTITDEELLAEVPSLMNVYEAALAIRPEISNAQLAIKKSEVNEKIAKAGWMPTVSMTAGVSTSTNSLASNGWGSQLKTNVNASGGVSINVPIYDGRSTKTAVNKAKIAKLQADLDLLEKQKTLYADIQYYWLGVINNQQKYKTAESSVQSAQDSYDLLSEQFNLGLKNIVELMTGKDKLLQAQQNQLQSKYQALLDEIMLEFYQSGIIK